MQSVKKKEKSIQGVQKMEERTTSKGVISTSEKKVQKEMQGKGREKQKEETDRGRNEKY